MANESHSVQFAGGNLGGQRHICASSTALTRSTGCFTRSSKMALTGEIKPSISLTPSYGKNISSGSPKQVSMCKTRWTPANWRCGRGKTLRFAEAGFDQEAWLESFEQVLQSGPAAGYAQTRFLAHMEWALVNLAGRRNLIEFETRVNYVVPSTTI